MDWANERWVRLYTRDTTTWKMLDWRARTVLMHLLRKVDRAGVLDVGDTGTMGLAAVLELPLEIVEPGVERLLHPRLRVVVETPTAYVLPNYLEAQEAVQTTNHRSAEYRARKRAYALAAAKPAIAELVRLPAPARIGDDVAPRDGAITKRDASDDGVTPRDGSVTFRDASITCGRSTSQTLDPGDSERADVHVATDLPICSIVTKRDADITPRGETITRHHATSPHVTPILSDPKDLSPSARAIPVTPEQADEPAPPAVAAVPPPAPVREDIAGTQLAMPAFDPNDGFARGRLAEATWHRISDAAIAIAAELGLPAPLPFPAITPSSNRRGFAELRDRIREEGELAPEVCDRVVENVVRQARAKRSVEWLAEKVFGDKPWVNARNGIDPSARSAPSQRAGPQGSAERAPSNEPPRRQPKTLTRS